MRLSIGKDLNIPLCKDRCLLRILHDNQVCLVLFVDFYLYVHMAGLRAMADAIHAEVAAAVQARSHVHNEEKSST